MRRAVSGLAVVLVAALCGSVITIALRGTPAPASPRPPSAGTATVVRTDLTSTVLTEGTLGYAPSPPIVNRHSGTYTSLLSAGNEVTQGQFLYRVDDQPVMLLYGTLPAWRPFVPGMTDGPDVQELQADLIALGEARGLLATAGPHFGTGVAAAVRRWQAAVGWPVTGSIDLGDVVFEPGPVRINSVSAALGQPAAAGDTPYQVTTTNRIVNVPLTPSDPAVAVGASVSVILPSAATTGGRVTAAGPPASASGSSSSSSSPAAAATVLTVTPLDPPATGAGDGVAVQVSLEVQRVRHVVAVPIAALLALSGGGYALEVVGPSGRHHLVGVHTGVFAGGDVQVSGSGVQPGQRVVVAQ